ncbi:hypothetical protein BDZ45DRAFT_285767 [Acephala macrosclerotiorum]|nr:hypothetical protein BDZ45DRAFT_285767 [Acephala macrosclerotiorum]
MFSSPGFLADYHLEWVPEYPSKAEHQILDGIPQDDLKTTHRSTFCHRLAFQLRCDKRRSNTYEILITDDSKLLLKYGRYNSSIEITASHTPNGALIFAPPLHKDTQYCSSSLLGFLALLLQSLNTSLLLSILPSPSPNAIYRPQHSGSAYYSRSNLCLQRL